MSARRTGIALLLCGAVVVVGLGLVAAALILGGSSPAASSATASPSPEADAMAPEPEDAGSADAGSAEEGYVPSGIVLLSDPAWVLRVSEASGIPARALSAYAGADLYAREHYGCEVGWNTLAAIGFVESEHGTLQGGSIEEDGVARPSITGIALDGTSSAAIPDTDGGAIDGDDEWDRAMGPMQFIPDTWGRWGTDGDEDGVADIHDIDDAALTAARYLCQAHGTMAGQDAWIAAIRSYNDSADYQRRVADAADHYAQFTTE